MLRITLLFVSSALAACGEESRIKDVVKHRLKDPESAQFKDTIYSPDGKRACLIWNAKNSMGGYGNWNIAELKKMESEWIVNNLDGSKYNCSDAGFKALDAGEKAEADAKVRAIEQLGKVKHISSADARTLGLTGECRSLVWTYAYYAKNVAELQVRFQKGQEPLPHFEKGLKDAQEKLNTGNCSERAR